MNEGLLKRRMLAVLRVVLAVCLGFNLTVGNATTVVELPATGPQPIVRTVQGKEYKPYVGSYALLISASEYLGVDKGGWRPLRSTSQEMDEVADAMRKHGFLVWRVSNPTSVDFIRVTRRFMAKYGREENNRLVFFFSGHGYTKPKPNDHFGYLVPVDAKHPRDFPDEFYEKAIPISRVENWARELEVRHALFLFDSCFSGTIFTARSETVRPEIRDKQISKRWRFLTKSANKPVRQFISAGGPDQVLPARSAFVPLFVQALSGSAAQADDGYVTGKEIGSWLEQELPKFSRAQTPLSGVIREPRLAFGDMVFQVPVRFEQVVDVEPQEKAPVVNDVAELVVRSNVTGDTWYIDQRRIGATSQIAHQTVPGQHKIRVLKEGYVDSRNGDQEWSETVDLLPGKKTTVWAKLSPQHSYRPGGAENAASNSEIGPAQRQVLDGLIRRMAKDRIGPQVVLVYGYSYSLNDAKENVELSVKRAQSVKNHLILRGIPENRIYIEGKGSVSPVESDRTAKGRASNRRAEVEVVGRSPEKSLTLTVRVPF